MSVSSYRDLEVWKKAVQLAKAVYRMTEAFPRHEVYGITSQLRRAAVSVPANIAEGRVLATTKEFLRHLSIARGSLAELETLLTIAEQLAYCQPGTAHEILHRCDEISRMLSGLRNSLKRRMKCDRPPSSLAPRSSPLP
jgi:four helix bundle protein